MDWVGSHVERLRKSKTLSIDLSNFSTIPYTKISTDDLLAVVPRFKDG